MQVLELLANIADNFFDRQWAHLTDKFGLQGLWSLVKEVPCEPIFLWRLRSPRTLPLLVNETDVDQISFAQKVHEEAVGKELV